MIQQLQLSELKRHAMTGVSYMLPLVVASGLLIAIGNICGNNPPVISDYKSPYTLWQAAVTLGVYGMGLSLLLCLLQFPILLQIDLVLLLAY